MLIYKNNLNNSFYYSESLLPAISNNFLLSRTKKFKHILKLNKHNKSLINYNFKSISYDLLFIFYIVVNFGSLNVASKYLGMTQPSLSLSLSKIEKEIGCILFKTSNSKRTLQLTIAGLVVFNNIKRLFQITFECLNFTNNKLTDFNIANPTYVKKDDKNLFSVYNWNLLFLRKVKSNKRPILYNAINRNCNYYCNTAFDSLTKLFFIKKKIIIFTKNLLKLDANKNYTSEILNYNVMSTLHKNSSMEVHTLIAIQICSEMKISNFIYWINTFK